MSLADGYYGSTAEAFEYISRRTSFRLDNGLPGMAWASGKPVFIEDLGKSARFLRAETATRVGINRGFAMPCPVPTNETYVMAFLSALGTPIVRRFAKFSSGNIALPSGYLLSPSRFHVSYALAGAAAIEYS